MSTSKTPWATAKPTPEQEAWKNLKVDLLLGARKFPNNKIYGVISVEPESARALIDHFVLVVPGVSAGWKHDLRLEFSRDYERISATGWSNKEIDRCVRIEAVPIEQLKATCDPKQSNLCPFSFTGKCLSPSPTLSFERGRDSKPVLVVEWYHLGDALADQYVMYIDGVDIQYIRRKLINDEFKVCIEGFEAGQKHTFQLAAKLRHSKHTRISDLLEFTVPDFASTDAQSEPECITLGDEPMPVNLPIVVKGTPDEDEYTTKQILENLQNRISQDDYISDRSQTSSVCESSTSSHVHGKCSGCQHLPHTKFPGLDHYFRVNTSSVSSSRKPSANKNQQQADAHSDDDDDVVIPLPDGTSKK